eukprot:5683523-Alexandrium_andersonii.AAC.1
MVSWWGQSQPSSTLVRSLARSPAARGPIRLRSLASQPSGPGAVKDVRRKASSTRCPVSGGTTASPGVGMHWAYLAVKSPGPAAVSAKDELPL